MIFWVVVVVVVCALAEVRLGFRTPRNGSTVLRRVEPEVDLWVDDHRRFMADFGQSARLCCAVDGRGIECERLESTRLEIGDLEVGEHRMTCVLIDTRDGSHLLRPCCNATTRFRVVETPLETEDGARFWQLKAEEDKRTRDIIAWWHGGPPPAYFEELRRGSWVGAERPNLVVGVKCSADNVVARDAMRRTWLSSGLVEVRFAIGKSQYQRQLEREDDVFGDLLVPPSFSVDDGYATLVAKTKEFLRYAVIEFPATPFIMLVDDDVLIDAPRLVEALPTLPKENFYGGQVWAEHFNQPKLPQRDPKHRNFLPHGAYPMSELPPFAIGPHYILSRDCAEFVASTPRLAAVGTLEDVSMAVWMFAIGVKPQHTEQFANARLFGCLLGAISLADLTPLGILAIHENRVAGRPACEGYDNLAWVKQPRFKIKRAES
ncbi:hypothetical protein CTAYLR_003405 [Chrysophaeum taylorii]|uniref:Hexosyltransferase n=1 Tax=Chrysophaeum taylorii TaxID=2483200 RepID=A0AAD7XIM3_9STRA|nr:hypothetical protein CTAYLR_003405 [Chrysophaeum taylorii]